MPCLDVRISLATERDRATVLTLLAEHLPGADVARRHTWLYEQNPHGRAVTLLAFDAAGAPVGLTSLFPRRVLVDGVPGVASIGGDGYVRPAFRRMGVATALHRESLALMRRGAVELMCGDPVPNNLAALARAGSRRVTTLRRFVRPGLLHRALTSVAHLAPRARPRLDPLRGADRRVADVWERSAEGAGVLLVRDPAHYAWRFERSPHGVQRAYAVVDGGATAAVCALERRGRDVAVVDFLAPRPRRAAALRALADAADVASLALLLNSAGDAPRDALRAGFLPREERGFQVLVPDDHPARDALLDPARWYYTWGDGDVDQVL